MKQPIKKSISNTSSIKSVSKKKTYKPKKTFKKSSNASELDGSGLEAYFRINFLDKLGIKYEQQFEAKDIGRFFDFHLKDNNNMSINVLVEIDGDFYHSNPNIYESPITPTQKRNKRVDKLKTQWALLHSFCLIRIWESDIYNDPQKVMEMLTSRINTQSDIIMLNESKKNGTFYIKKS